MLRPFAEVDPARLPVVIGCDEVGVGAWCGPVVAGATWFDPAALPREILDALDDSKRLSAPRRRDLDKALRATVRWALAARSAAAIDAYGLRPMIAAALADAVGRLGVDGPVVVDGSMVPPTLGNRATALVRGDAQVPQVAAASIIAKVCRDRLMARLDARHPAYGWVRNAGYGTALHRAGLLVQGVSAHHRRTYAPVRACEMVDNRSTIHAG